MNKQDLTTNEIESREIKTISEDKMSVEAYSEARFLRTEMLLGREALLMLKSKKVLICGLGGVGGMACEALARSGIGYLRLVDFDKVSASNANRQLIADFSTLGQSKVKLWQNRLALISPDVEVDCHELYLDIDTLPSLLEDIDAVVDCIDSVGSKLDLIREAQRRKIPLISAMGAANKTDPTRLKISKLSKTTTCPLARRLRQTLAKEKLTNIPVVWSDEAPSCPFPNPNERKGGGPAPASMMIVPAVAGLYLANYILKELLKNNKMS